VNSPQDDSYAYALSTSLQAQARGLTQANINTNLTMGLLETASSAIDSQLDILQRLREIAVEASSSSLNSQDRQNLQTEVQSLLNEFRRITSDTEFNGEKLLDGSFGRKRIQVGSGSTDSISLELGSLKASDIFTKNAGTGQFASRTTIAMSAQSPYASALGDFNQDGKLDLAVTQSGAGIDSNLVYVYEGKGDGNFLQGKAYDIGWNPVEIRTGDVTGDGVLDLVTADSGSSQVSVLAGNGDGTFDTTVPLSTGTTPVDVELVDLDSDGVLDIVSLDQFSGYLSVFQSNGDGTFGTATTYALGATDRTTLASGDFNGDGNPDLIVGGGASTNASLFLGSSTGALTAGTAISSLNRSLTGIAVADLDNDGDLDFASTSTNSGNLLVRISLNSGLGTFTTSTANTVGLNAQDIKAADLNKDGYQDLFVLNEDARSISVLLATGAATYSNVSTLTTGGSSTNGAFDLAVGDINNDGAVDLIAGEYTNGTGQEVSIFLARSQSMSAERDVGVNTATQAQDLLSIVDSAINAITKEQASVSAIHSRLRTTYAANLLLIENFREADSLATDVDLALETAELARNQILQQAQTAVLAQANLSMQAVISLLGGLETA
jgi:flagellin-like hook-associated protein FlgL